MAARGRDLHNRAMSQDEINRLIRKVKKYKNQRNQYKSLLDAQFENNTIIKKRLAAIDRDLEAAKAALEKLGGVAESLMEDYELLKLHSKYAENWISFIGDNPGQGDCARALDRLKALHRGINGQHGLYSGFAIHKCSSTGSKNWFIKFVHHKHGGKAFKWQNPQGDVTNKSHVYISFANTSDLLGSSMSAAKFKSICKPIAEAAVQKHCHGGGAKSILEQVWRNLNKKGIFPTLVYVKKAPGGFGNWGYNFLGTRRMYHEWHTGWTFRKFLYTDTPSYCVGIRA